MKYRNTTIDMQPGDEVNFRTCFSWRPITWLALLIRLFTHSRYNHSALVIELRGILYLIEAQGAGIIIRPASICLARRRDKIMVRRPKANYWDVTDRALSALGRPYDWLAILQQAVYRIFKRWTGHTGDFAQSTMICSEFVAWAYGMKDYWLIVPGDLCNSDFFTTIYTEA